jgi:tetratricopeptide (TPR) repeat protein
MVLYLIESSLFFFSFIFFIYVAIEAYDKADEIDPNYQKPGTKGAAFNKLGKYDEAAKSFGEAMMRSR